MKIVRITKSVRRVYSDNNYGSIAAGTEITVEQEVNTPEELKDLNAKMAKNARVLTNQDIKNYIAAQQEGKAL